MPELSLQAQQTVYDRLAGSRSSCYKGVGKGRVITKEDVTERSRDNEKTAFHSYGNGRKSSRSASDILPGTEYLSLRNTHRTRQLPLKEVPSSLNHDSIPSHSGKRATANRLGQTEKLMATKMLSAAGTMVPLSMAKSRSMVNISIPADSSLQIGNSNVCAYGRTISTKSVTSLHTSPKRITGLGARTVSPTEVQRLMRNTPHIGPEATHLTAARSHLGLAEANSTLRKSSTGIPSPIKAITKARARPSPIPPVPPLPKQVEQLEVVRSTNSSGFKRASKSVPANLLSVGPRQRSVTVGNAVCSRIFTTNDASRNEGHISFVSPTKPNLERKIARHPSLNQKQLQPLTLPPLNVHALSTPTVRRVHAMDKDRLSFGATVGLEGSTRVDRHSITVGVSYTSESLTPPNTNLPLCELQAAQAAYRYPSRGAAAPGAMYSCAKETERTPSFFQKMSLSRGGSLSKVAATNAKRSMKSVEISPVSPMLLTNVNKVDMRSPKSPSTMKRLGLSWMKGKKSPFPSVSPPERQAEPMPQLPAAYQIDSTTIGTAGFLGHAQHAADSFVLPEVQALERNIGDESTKAISSSEITTSNSPGSIQSIADEEMRFLLIKRRGARYLCEEEESLAVLRRKAIRRKALSLQETPLMDEAALNLYEKGEIIDYEDNVYFTGQKGLSKKGGRLHATNNLNFGYDDERGDYQVVGGDHFAYRYEVIDLLGKGSFGQVLRCIDYKTGRLVAVKVIRNKKRFHAQALVEVKILQKLRQWDPDDLHSLIRFTDHFHFRGHLCISTDLLGMNLYEYIKWNDFKGCSLSVIRSFTTQILSCLALLKTHKVIHCDLKPENILLVNPWRSEIRVIDFGSSCFESEKVYTYIQSRFYRSPEVILGMSYGLPIDIWSTGCILAELFTGYPIFPGENEQEQLACIMEVFGPPERQLIENSTRKKLFFDATGKPRTVTSSKGKRRRPSTKSLAQAIKCQDDAFVDFLKQCLKWNPNSRIDPAQALQHAFVTQSKLPSRQEIETPNLRRRLFTGASASNMHNTHLRLVPDSFRREASYSGRNFCQLETDSLKPEHSRSERANNTLLSGSRSVFESPGKKQTILQCGTPKISSGMPNLQP